MNKFLVNVFSTFMFLALISIPLGIVLALMGYISGSDLLLTIILGVIFTFISTGLLESAYNCLD